MSDCKKDTLALKLIKADQIPVWGEPQLSDKTYLRASVVQYNQQLGAEEMNTFNIPIQDIIGAVTSGDASVAKNGTDIKDLSDRQVMPAYISRNAPYPVFRADKDHHAKFLVVGEDKNDADYFGIKADGVFVFPEGHDYVVGADYYLDQKGNVSTDSAASNQHLFYVLNNRAILIKLGE